MSPPPLPRPASLDRAKLGFDPQPPVRWLSPGQLWHTAVKALLSTVIGQYADGREGQAAMDATYSASSDYSSGDATWVDYLADTGDGFDATMSMALLVGQKALRVGDQTLPRARVLVLGGDEVYPTASMTEYRNRFIGPFKSANPWVTDEADAPQLYALPGNHDWYDGLTSFLRVFAQQKWIGGWQTRQQRSYFAIRLRPHWWLWAIDNQFDSYIDRPQLQYFRDAATHMSADDAVVLCTSRPTWVDANDAQDVEAFAPTDYFERTIIRPTGASVRLWVSGDSHHYARYQSQDGTQYITAGGGGAFLSATHHLPDDIEVPPARSIDTEKSSPPRTARLQTTYPERPVSRALGLGVFGAVFKNGGFFALIAFVYAMIALAVRSDLPWLAFVILSVLLAGFTKRSNKLIRWSVGLVHATSHLALAWYADHMAQRVVDNVHGMLHLCTEVGIVAATGALFGSLVFAMYLYAVDSLFAINTNELFSSMHIEGYKNFLRMHFTDEDVTIHSVCLKTPSHKWEARPNDHAESPWVAPEMDLAPQLIESPIVVSRTP